jgi:hypothetical protein
VDVWSDLVDLADHERRIETIDPELNYEDRDFATEIGTDGVTDMACWDREAILLWRNQDDGRVRLQITFVGECIYESCPKFLDAAMEDGATKEFPGADR